MGLAIVRSIWERHLGRVRAEKVPGGGAFFILTLPAERTPGPAASRA
jgi:signal transduction histidine kinase